MIIVGYDILGVIVFHFVPHGKTVTADYYRSFLQRHLGLAMREKHPDLKETILYDKFTYSTECKATIGMLEMGSTVSPSLLPGSVSM